MSFLYALDELGTDGELSQTGATLVSPWIAQLNFIGGICAVGRGDLKLGQRHLREASSLDSRSTSTRMELALVSTKMGEFDPAEEQIEFVLIKTEDPCVIARALRLRGYIEIERGDLTDAYVSYTKSLDYEPGSQLARNELSVIYHTMESQGFKNLPPSEYVPPPKGQLLFTRCTN
jgi:tetratricopeptide (TPR) repeat protein